MTIIAQLSDLHIRPAGVLYQDVVDSNAMLANAIATLNALAPRPDFVLITGDLTDEGAPEEYVELRRLLTSLTIPYAVMPGNHDQRENLRNAFPEHEYLPKQGPLHFALDVGEVRIIALDTSVPDLHHGELDRNALTWLDAELHSSHNRPTIVAMHHPPFDTGIPYLDIYGLLYADRFSATLTAHSHVERVIAGHVHRSMQTRVGHVPVLTCPSTVTQIALQTDAGAQPASYLEPPAFLLHCCAQGKPSISHLVYVDRFEGPFPFA
ncbi:MULTISPECIES: phosphodiesterase [unclassified Paraburkholderia]|uniref:phosphodiesterase n=1 Tax=unclassified Paraburkholderia TaxID=2615204 RepID=UPI002AB31BB3|nr:MULTISPECIES: phosphodiesterase [unclassified Paraburkholderia]